MTRVAVGALTFTFPVGWRATKADDWRFYRGQFEKYFNGVRLSCSNCAAEVRCRECNTAKAIGVKAVDIVAIAPGPVAWLIEVKDYRQHQRTKAMELADEAAVKVRDSLAMFSAASKNANDAGEKADASAIGSSSVIRVVLHVEQVQKPSRLFPRGIDPAKVEQRLRQLIKFVDPHPRVVESTSMRGVPWTVA